MDSIACVTTPTSDSPTSATIIGTVAMKPAPLIPTQSVILNDCAISLVIAGGSIHQDKVAEKVHTRVSLSSNSSLDL